MELLTHHEEKKPSPQAYPHYCFPDEGTDLEVMPRFLSKFKAMFQPSLIACRLIYCLLYYTLEVINEIHGSFLHFSQDLCSYGLLL